MKQCVCTTTFAVLVNGRPQGGWIHPQRGIRQGYPLAPLLFILAADTLAICTEYLCIRGYPSGFQTTGRPGGIPLLQYADDTTFFIRGSTVAAHHVSAMLDIFSDFSGLQLSRSKSSIVGIGLDSEELARISTPVLSTPVASLPIRYLRLPLAEGRLHKRDWQPVMAKIEARLGGWQARLLSRDGHLVLLQSVLAAIPIYFMAIFKIPEGLRRQIESIMRRFWHGSRPSENRGVALVAWRIVCRPKSHGSLGIRQIRHTNTALLAKWVNRIMQQLEDLAVVVLRGSYGATIDWAVWSTPRRGDSAFMQGLRPVFTSMQSLFRPCVGDGASFNFWEADWSGYGRFRDSHPRLYALALDPGATVRTVWDTGWFPSLPSTLSDQRYADLLALHTSLVPLQLSERAPDVWEWRGGRFSARAVYRHFQDLESSSDSTMLLKCCRLL